MNILVTGHKDAGKSRFIEFLRYLIGDAVYSETAWDENDDIYETFDMKFVVVRTSVLVDDIDVRQAFHAIAEETDESFVYIVNRDSNDGMEHVLDDIKWFETYLWMDDVQALADLHQTKKFIKYIMRTLYEDVNI